MRPQGSPKLLEERRRSVVTFGVKEVDPAKAEAKVKAEGGKISFQTLDLNLLLSLEAGNNESAREEISLLGMWNRNSMHESR